MYDTSARCDVVRESSKYFQRTFEHALPRCICTSTLNMGCRLGLHPRKQLQVCSKGLFSARVLRMFLCRRRVRKTQVPMTCILRLSGTGKCSSSWFRVIRLMTFFKQVARGSARIANYIQVFISFGIACCAWACPARGWFCFLRFLAPLSKV